MYENGVIYPEEEYLQLSGLQHFAFCRRQWALIHLEQQWAENLLTVQGSILHEKAHDSDSRELRGDVMICRGMKIHSAQLGVSGACDVVEFHRAEADGVTLPNRDGLWQPCPVEYKRGVPKLTDADRLQLCAQGMCLAEMLCCNVTEGAIFYGQTRHREIVPFTDELCQQVRTCLEEMHTLFRRNHTPMVKPGKNCKACSLHELCLPKLCQKKSVATYLRLRAEEDV